ncbi:DUF192 domain-containing protein [Paracoccus marinaquae]|uniref:DUF192 domain-containing protein n=1 Tax=Paracoccus marinaquae TaxID=2841926 RepID=UPI0032AFF47F
MLSALILAGTSVAAAPPPADCAPDRAIFLTSEGTETFRIEIADTVEERGQGLMYRRSLPAGEGMLFIYDEPAELSFWMRNTLIPLDMIFLDEKGVIRHVKREAQPLDETPVPGAAPGDPDPERLMVLEIAGGEALRLGLAPGQPMAHPRLDPSLAAWPCR